MGSEASAEDSNLEACQEMGQRPSEPLDTGMHSRQNSRNAAAAGSRTGVASLRYCLTAAVVDWRLRGGLFRGDFQPARRPAEALGLDMRAAPGNPNHSSIAFRAGWGFPGLNVGVFYHDKCFDGACSASLFTRFHRECIAEGARYEYHGLVHRAGALFNDSDFTGDENAIVDFKYSSSPRVTWWFDHHLSAFLTPEDQRKFLDGQQRDATRDRQFYDPSYTSCTSFIAHIAETRFGFNAAPVAELIRWADIVDGALYTSAQAAVGLAEPAMKLTLIIESNQDPDFIPRLIPLLTSMSLAEILAQPFVQSLLPPLLEKHRQSLALIGQRAESRAGTIYFDIADHPVEGYNKFIPYFLHPEVTYSVGLSKSSFRTKVAVGTNPWTRTKPEEMLNLSAICERYGGGGHARVGAISFPPDQEEKARSAAAEIVKELRAHEHSR